MPSTKKINRQWFLGAFKKEIALPRKKPTQPLMEQNPQILELAVQGLG
jgi:hypothetical protein